MISGSEYHKEYMKGTTTVGLICEDGVVLATDKRATMGNLIADKEAKKLYKIDDYIAMTIAGSVGDAQSLIRLLSAEAKIYKMRTGNNMTPLSCTTLTSNVLHGNRHYPLLTQLIIGGYDLINGPKLFSLDPVGGINEESSFTATGSGSPTAYGVLEAEYKSEINIEKGLLIAVKALISAMQRDAYSGNGISLAKIDKTGVTLYSDEEIENLVKKVTKKK
ncbi:Proteasome endopeptidase complex [Methanococcus vannielii SB]|jgi:proteasome beta subunit|uniref:Proteasome subunit beta n=1 Tax=Methanococcus vannielii (strain ATCC 35089 / DSM 1224 / JCM 13029 / OCM 148 / SB) TaxID=406327 RepID=PSB_METVS|nr:archaeal proteasome endopeptidase complex subunit beta [Methanococcus vannielii]A6USJ3.1 RecName: Full=Proteasome subunit beta; AltName: Full=20S proteasome beta subunit; AltName: Full=Proteasome core protein PsmB; Flags: Precursor [Methanococcus vannielii SB]ABR55465.1 Proteasome endopeptidase complex [Methanococcus vannielii SB]